jgi:hypothetical protein
MSADEALHRIRLAKPYDNLNCRQCHTATARVWTDIPDHRAMQAEIFENRVSCASEGCHGFAHPFTKDANAALRLRSDANLAPTRELP